MTLPSARVGIHGSAIKESYVISSLEWKNIWVYGMEIILAGYLNCKKPVPAHCGAMSPA